MNKEAEILRYLKINAGRFSSGEKISSKLGVSRSAVWKHIKSLRAAGYLIDSSTNKGYALLPGEHPFNGLELSASISTEIIGKKVFFFSECDSTNSKAMELAKDGAEEGSVVVADTQKIGKGRRGRAWHSPQGVNLYTSIILRPDISPQRAPILTLLSAVAVADAIAVFSPQKPALKWPNDILIQGKKVSGILLEMSSEMDMVNFVIVGIGVNVNMDMKKSPKEIQDTATSLKEKSGSVVDRVEFAIMLYSKFEKWYKIFLKQGSAPIIGAWRSSFDGEGKPVKISGREDVRGICLGIDDEGALLVRIPGGAVEKVISGDVDYR